MQAHKSRAATEFPTAELWRYGTNGRAAAGWRGAGRLSHFSQMSGGSSDWSRAAAGFFGFRSIESRGMMPGSHVAAEYSPCRTLRMRC